MFSMEDNCAIINSINSAEALLFRGLNSVELTDGDLKETLIALIFCLGSWFGSTLSTKSSQIRIKLFSQTTFTLWRTFYPDASALLHEGSISSTGNEGFKCLMTSTPLNSFSAMRDYELTCRASYLFIRGLFLANMHVLMSWKRHWVWHFKMLVALSLCFLFCCQQGISVPEYFKWPR